MHKFWIVPPKEPPAVYGSKLLNFPANQPFLSKMFNAIAKYGHAKPKKGRDDWYGNLEGCFGKGRSFASTTLSCFSITL